MWKPSVLAALIVLVVKAAQLIKTGLYLLRWVDIMPLKPSGRQHFAKGLWLRRFSASSRTANASIRRANLRHKMQIASFGRNSGCSDAMAQ